MRNILFRGKHLDNGEWVYGYLFITNDGKHHIKWDGEPKESEVDPKTVGLFTGQYDECDDPIFEGDIVYCESEDEHAVIEWDNDTSKFIIQFDGGWISDFDHFYGHDLEVIYSIFDKSDEIDLFDE